MPNSPIDFGNLEGILDAFRGNRHRRARRKTTVEESMSLGIGDFRIHPRSAGTFVWEWATGDQAAVSYAVAWGTAGPILTLHYHCWWDDEDVQIPIRLQTTPTQFGGERWWFSCPLLLDGVPCKRRVGKLYLPPGVKYFGCRLCHDLTYRSSQEARRTSVPAGVPSFPEPRLDPKADR
jgi:hypothetical protein